MAKPRVKRKYKVDFSEDAALAVDDIYDYIKETETRARYVTNFLVKTKILNLTSFP